MVYALNVLILSLVWRTLIENIPYYLEKLFIQGGRVISSGINPIRNHGDPEKYMIVVEFQVILKNL